AEDGIRDDLVTGVQTCALPICSRTLEYLSKILPRLPQGVNTELGPDATGVGWVFQYAVVDPSGRHNLADLRSVEDWYLRYHLQEIGRASCRERVSSWVVEAWSE